MSKSFFAVFRLKALPVAAAVVAVLGLNGSSVAATAQTGTTSPQVAQLASAVAEYHRSSSRAKPGQAKDIARLLRLAEQSGVEPTLNVEARLAILDGALLENKKSEALKQANLAIGALRGVDDINAQKVKARALGERARALSANEDYMAAGQAIIEARLLYGTRAGATDVAWHRLWMIHKNVRLEASRRRVEIPVLDTESEGRLWGGRAQYCDGVRITRIANVGTEPQFPGLRYLTLYMAGGGVVSVSLNEAGQVTSSRVLAYGPTDGFAEALAEAVPTWKFQISAPEGVSTAACRADHLVSSNFIVQRNTADILQRPPLSEPQYQERPKPLPR